MGCRSFLQALFLTQGSNVGLLHCRQTLYSLSYQGSPVHLLSRVQLYTTPRTVPHQAVPTVPPPESNPYLIRYFEQAEGVASEFFSQFEPNPLPSSARNLLVPESSGDE